MNALRRINLRDATSLSEAHTPKPDMPELPPVIDSAELFAGKPEILIAHKGMHYRLKVTRQGKLILTK